MINAVFKTQRHFDFNSSHFQFGDHQIENNFGSNYYY